MRLAFRISLLAIGLVSLLGPGASSAGTLVEFPNLPGHNPANLGGYLARPDSGLSAELGGPLKYGAPFPAVVVLHGCNGMFGHSAVIADRLSSWGYVTLAVDSLGPRVIGIANRCGRGLPDQAFDAYAALRYLSQLDFVDPARVAVFGQSMGGDTAVSAVDRDLAAQFFAEQFRAAIAYYPFCEIPAATMTAPTLILIGEADETSPVEQCRGMVAHARPDGAPISLTVYPGVHHSFDVALLTPGVRYRGYWLEYNEAAAKDAEEKTRAFLAAHLAETSPGEPTTK
jgi:dienelactone hydrolase